MRSLSGLFNSAAKPLPFTPQQQDAYFSAIKDDNDARLAELLAEAPGLLGASTNIQIDGQSVKRTGLVQAILSASDSCFQYLLARNTEPLNAADGSGSALLTLALEKHNDSAALALIDNGALYLPADGKTPLMLAFERNNQPFSQELLKRKFSMADRDKQGRTPLFFAIYNGNADNITLARRSGGDIHALTDNGQTLLMEAARCGNTTAMDWMVAEKLDINARDKDGRTALHYLALDTASFNLVNAAEKLLANGAYINTEDNNGQTLESLLRASGKKPELLEFMIEADKNPGYARVPLKIEIFHEGTTRKLRPLRPTRFKAPV